MASEAVGGGAIRPVRRAFRQATDPIRVAAIEIALAPFPTLSILLAFRAQGQRRVPAFGEAQLYQRQTVPEPVRPNDVLYRRGTGDAVVMRSVRTTEALVRREVTLIKPNEEDDNRPHALVVNSPLE